MKVSASISRGVNLFADPEKPNSELPRTAGKGEKLARGEAQASSRGQGDQASPHSSLRNGTLLNQGASETLVPGVGTDNLKVPAKVDPALNGGVLPAFDAHVVETRLGKGEAKLLVQRLRELERESPRSMSGEGVYLLAKHLAVALEKAFRRNKAMSVAALASLVEGAVQSGEREAANAAPAGRARKVSDCPAHCKTSILKLVAETEREDFIALEVEAILSPVKVEGPKISALEEALLTFTSATAKSRAGIEAALVDPDSERFAQALDRAMGVMKSPLMEIDLDALGVWAT